MDDLVSFLPVLLGLFALPLFFYKLDKGGLLLSLAIQFILVYVVSCQIPPIPVMFYLFWGVYAFSVCCFLEVRRFRNMGRKIGRFFVFPTLALGAAVLVFSLCCLLGDDMIDWVLFKDYPIKTGTGFLATGISFYLFTLVVHLYYIFAYQSYKVRYFVLSMLPYLLVFISWGYFFGGWQLCYFWVTLFFWMIAMAVAFFIKNRYG